MTGRNGLCTSREAASTPSYKSETKHWPTSLSGQENSASTYVESRS